MVGVYLTIEPRFDKCYNSIKKTTRGGSMFESYLDDYYKSKIGVKEMCDLVGSSPTTFRRWLKKNNLTPRQKYLKLIDTGDEGLDQTLKDRYSSIVNRCNGKTTDYYGKYKGKPYIPVYEWVEFCNDHKEKLLAMWEVYEKNSRDMRYSISVDRIDDEDGYTKENTQFVTHGFNSWKRNIFPIKVAHDNETNFFLTREDASLFYGLRKQAIGEIYNKTPYHIKGYNVEKSTVEEVLDNNNLKTLEEYYSNLLKTEEKSWDKRVRENRNPVK